MEKIIFYGADWCQDCKISLKVFEQSEELWKEKFELEYINIDENEEAVKKVQELNKGYKSIPTIVFPDSQVLVEPTIETLTQKLENL